MQLTGLLAFYYMAVGQLNRSVNLFSLITLNQAETSHPGHG